MSSPLTSLSSLDDLDEQALTPYPQPTHDAEDLKVAQVIMLLSDILFRIG
jgi:hypothetical protein